MLLSHSPRNHTKPLVAMLLATTLFWYGCNTPNQTDNPEPPTPIEDIYDEPQAEVIHFTNAEFSYMGDDVGEATSDGWLIKFYTDMEIDPSGNPIGPGHVAQLLLNVTYNPQQEAESTLLAGDYIAQSNSGSFPPFTFVYGYMDYIELPTGRHERADGTFYATIDEGVTTMDYDLIDDGAIEIRRIDGENYLIEGVLVGKKCYKRHFSWQGKIEPTSYVEPQVPNSTLSSALNLTNLSQIQLQDRGDIFYLKDESYRCLLVYVAEEGVDLSVSKPEGSGNMMRLELLVPWNTDILGGIPEGSYPMIARNADTSFDRDAITPFHSIAGLPDCFTYPYWSGTWYVRLSEGLWSDSYARIDAGTIVVERKDGKHILSAELKDSSTPAHDVTFSMEVADSSIITL